jgi:hypothetical protein
VTQKRLLQTLSSYFSDSFKRVLLGNPYTALPIIRREERSKGPLRALIGVESTGITSSCCIMPSWSKLSQLSATLPASENRKMPILVTVILLPVGAMPLNSPWWVPRIVQRVATLSSSAIWSLHINKATIEAEGQATMLED